LKSEARLNELKDLGQPGKKSRLNKLAKILTNSLGNQVAWHVWGGFPMKQILKWNFFFLVTAR
jgi:hypothetical protein